MTRGGTPDYFNVQQLLTSLFFNIQLSVLVATAWSFEVTSCIPGQLYLDLQTKIKLDPYFRARDELFILRKKKKTAKHDKVID